MLSLNLLLVGIIVGNELLDTPRKGVERSVGIVDTMLDPGFARAGGNGCVRKGMGSLPGRLRWDSNCGKDFDAISVFQLDVPRACSFE